MKKKIVITFLINIFLVHLYFLSFAASSSFEITLYYKEVELITDVPPMLINGRTMVPIRAISEAMGLKVEWDSEHSLVLIETGEKAFELKDTNASPDTFNGFNTVNLAVRGEIISSDVPALIYNNRTLVPIRVISEALGGAVIWDASSKTVSISFEKNDLIKEDISNGGSKSDVLEISLDDGRVYIGEVLNGLPHGKGKMVFPDKTTYEGDFVKGLKEGNGKVLWSNGDVFEGIYSSNLRNGFGIYYFENGDRYEGNYKNDLREGKGIYYFSDGEVLDGFWENGEFVE